MNIDLYLFNLIHQLAGRFWPLDSLGIFFAKYLAYLLVVATLYFWLTRKTNKDKIFFIAFISLSLLLSRGIFTEGIRFFYHHERPFEALNFTPLISPDTASSFPSGHAAFFFALAFALYYFNRKWGTRFSVLALLMGLARIFVGTHYPSDILGGILIAFLSVFLVSQLLSKSGLAQVSEGKSP
jgi:undecaprenyl-diphosphatase